MDIWRTTSAKQRARIDVRARAGAFGVQAVDNRALLPVALLLLAILALAAPGVAAVGLAILASAYALRSAALRFLKRQHGADLADRNEGADADAAESRFVMTHAAATGADVARALRLPPPPPACTASGRALASVCLTPRLLSQRPFARTIARACCIA